MNPREIAAAMVKRAGHKPYASRVVGQLELALSIDVDNIILSISKADGKPSEAEIAKWRRAFDVPDRAERVNLPNGAVLSWADVP